MSAIALVIAAASPHITLAGFRPVKLLVIAAVSALAESLSPHGWDNLTMQIVPSALAGIWLA
jgi:hypothetical protein